MRKLNTPCTYFLIYKNYKNRLQVIFSHSYNFVLLYSDWIQESTDQKKLHICTLFTQCNESNFKNSGSLMTKLTPEFWNEIFGNILLLLFRMWKKLTRSRPPYSIDNKLKSIRLWQSWRFIALDVSKGLNYLFQILNIYENIKFATTTLCNICIYM